eukprot:ANDGO_01214.mRNA.1 putative U2 small nuclear ribonucleoprotein A'
MRLTVDLISKSAQFTNALGKRELDLRDRHIGEIENLGATMNVFDVLDFSNNDLTRIENIPELSRVDTVLASSNRIEFVSADFAQSFPNLQCLSLQQNNLSSLESLLPLFECRRLVHLSLLWNPVARLDNYRLWVIHNMPGLRVLDYDRVKKHEKRAARRLFARSAAAGSRISRSSSSSGGGGGGVKREASSAAGMEEAPSKKRAAQIMVPRLREDQSAKILEAIVKATNMEQVDRLERFLAAGKMPPELE